MRASRDTLSDAGRDLLLGASCVGCGRPGRVLCLACDASLPGDGRLAWPSPTPAGLVTPYAAGAYDGVLRQLVLQHKEHGVFALAAPLGRVLGDVVATLLDHEGASGDAVLVPVPSRRAVVRRRGHDPLLRVTREASRRLRRRGVPATVQQVLKASAGVRDQSTLGAVARAANLAGSLHARRGHLAKQPVVLVDDVLTTGSTAREAQRALEEAGVSVVGIGTVAATVRRLPEPGLWGGSLPFGFPGV